MNTQKKYCFFLKKKGRKCKREFGTVNDYRCGERKLRALNNVLEEKGV